MNLKFICTVAMLIGLLNVGCAQNPVVQNIINDVEIDSLTFFVKQLTGEAQVIVAGWPDTIHSRHKDQPGNEKAFQFVKQKFTGYGLQVDSLQFSTTGKNLLGILPGYLYPGKKFILGAHYDNVGGTVAPGADDNASGSAAVIEAARVFASYNFPFTIIFALWDEEEEGLLGSSAYASLAAANNEIILGYINMDMLGWDGNNDSVADLHVRPVASSLQLANKVIAADTIYNINLGLHIVNPGTGATDHAAFWNNGFTAIGINEEYDGDFNPFWHTPADSLAHFNLPFYVKCAKLAYATLAECTLDSANVLGLEDVSVFDQINIYPNPAANTIFINYPSAINRIDMYNELGILISNQDMNSNQMKQIDVGHLDNGIYLLQIHLDSDVFSKKVIISK